VLRRVLGNVTGTSWVPVGNDGESEADDLAKRAIDH